MLNREVVWKIIQKMELVQNVSNGQIKQAGEDIYFSGDEFSSHLIRSIPEMLIWLGKLANTGNPESMEALRQDLKLWIDQQETLLGIYLEDSNFKKLMGEEDKGEDNAG